MKSLLSALLLCLIVQNISAQSEEQSIPLVSYWSTSDTFNFRVTKTKSKWKNGSLAKESSNSYEASLVVLGSTSEGYRLKWSYELDLGGDYGLPITMIEKIANYELTEVIYTISEVGDFLGIENWQEISVMMEGILEDLFQLLAEENPEGADIIMQGVKPIFEPFKTKEGIEGLVFKELHYLHFPFGVEYFENDTITYQDLLPNMLGGDPIRGEVKLYVDSVDYEREYLKLAHTMQLNEEDALAMITSVFKRMAIADEELSTALEGSSISITDENTYEYYYYPGIPVIIETKRETLLTLDGDTGGGVESLKIEWID